MAKLAGQEGLEPPTGGFGDRCSTNWSYWPKNFLITGIKKEIKSLIRIFIKSDYCAMDLNLTLVPYGQYAFGKKDKTFLVQYAQDAISYFYLMCNCVAGILCTQTE